MTVPFGSSGFFCAEECWEIFSVTTEQILHFLTVCFQKGSTYTTLNSTRAALGHILDENVLGDFRLRRFFKGVYNLRPTRPKYDNVWDPAIVLTYLETQKNAVLDLKALTLKLTALLLLSTGHRLQTVANIELCHIEQTSQGVTIKIPKRLKTSGRNRTQPHFLFSYFTNGELCVARLITLYLEKTKALRSPELTHLLITFQKPHRNATTQSIARWVKMVLTQCGIDTKCFTAHSTRHAATSAAARNGVSWDTIRQSAGWSDRSKVFATFYNRPLISKNFTQAILTKE
ncbi:hypothetical protein ABEB36_003644 [Hypothenemus hampei]|uniref:Tyr recombinase domain-containing protein n=1 Tax=Hypothenemus hampei TaxID=57062 RepID=A0ABD1F9U0_HYPHA